MNIEQLRDSFRSFLTTYLEEPVAGFLSKIRLNPNHITFLGIFSGLGAGFFALNGDFLFAGIMIFLNGFLDLMDGALARKLNLKSKRCAFFDSVADRFNEAIILTGIGIYFLRTSEEPLIPVTLVLISLVGSMMTSYMRARMEGLGTQGSPGFFTRPERVFVVMVGLLLNRPLETLWVLAIATMFGSLHRFISIWLRLKNN